MRNLHPAEQIAEGRPSKLFTPKHMDKHTTTSAPSTERALPPATRSAWIRCKDQMPPQNLRVETKIDDEKGVRNEADLVFQRRLWWMPDMSMYIYYCPTHWRLKPNA